MRKYFCLMVLVMLCASGIDAKAGVGSSLMQTANPVAVGDLEGKIQADLIFNRGGGFNLTAHGVSGIVDHLMDVDVFAGSGASNFQTGLMLKFNLLPDVPDQLGLSFNMGYRFIRDNETEDSDIIINHNLVTFGVLISKTTRSGMGLVVPYSSLQIESLFKQGDSTTPISLLVGTKWLPSGTQPWNFYTEAGISLRDSHFSANVGVSYDF